MSGRRARVPKPKQRTFRFRYGVLLTVVGIAVISGCSPKRAESESVIRTPTYPAAGTPAQPGPQPLRQYSIGGRHLAFSPDGVYVAVAGRNDVVYLWRASESSTDSIQQLRGHRQELHSCAFSPDGKWLVSAAGTIDVAFLTSCELLVWDVAAGAEVESLKGMSYPAHGTAFSPDGKYLAVTTDDETVVVWSTESRKAVQRLQGYQRLKFFYSVAWSPDSRWVAAAGSTGDVVIWEAATGREALRLRGHSLLVSSITFDRSGQRLLTSCWDKTVRLWDVASGRPLLVYSGHSNAVESACFSPDEKFVVSGGWDKTIRVWSAQTGADLRVLESHSDYVNATVFRPGHPELFSASRDGTVKVWDARQLLGK